MQITEVTVSWTETANLGNYSNVRPSLSLKATIDADDDPAAIQAALTDVVKGYVREQVDQALEAEGQAAKYSTEPRFDVLVEVWGNRHFIVIVPYKTRLQIDGTKSYPVATKLRLAAAQAYARERAKGVDRGDEIVAIYDASGDDMVIEDALLDITTAKAAYNAEQAEKRRQQEEAWEAQKQLRLAERERERAEREHMATAPDIDPDEDDDEDDDDDE